MEFEIRSSYRSISEHGRPTLWARKFRTRQESIWYEYHHANWWIRESDIEQYINRGLKTLHFCIKSSRYLIVFSVEIWRKEERYCMKIKSLCVVAKDDLPAASPGRTLMSTTVCNIMKRRRFRLDESWSGWQASVLG